MDRYIRNHTSISKEENQILKESKVAVVGCGGLGGHIIEMLGRIGLGTITAIDGDIFDETNLNRQLLCNEGNIGQSKAQAAKERIEIVNSEIEIIVKNVYLDRDSGEELLRGHDLVVDALDNIESRFIVQEVCKKLGIPLVHGAIAGWYGQVTTIYPGDDTLNKIYGKKQDKGAEKELGNPAFTPNLISSIQVAEVVKLITKKGTNLRKTLLLIDILDQEYNIIDF